MSKLWKSFHRLSLPSCTGKSSVEKKKHTAVLTQSVKTARDREDPHDNSKEKNPSALSTDEFMEFVGKG